MSAYFFYITASDENEAKMIGKTLIEENLAACVNILPSATSIYRWNDEIKESSESVIIGKTTEDLMENLKDKIIEIHSYDCPCIVAMEIDNGNPQFLDWVNSIVE